MWSPNYAEWVYIQFATAKIGAIQVNVNPAYRTSELEYALEQSGCRMLVTRTDYLTSKYRDMVETVAPNLSHLERVVYFDTPDWAVVGGFAQRHDGLEIELEEMLVERTIDELRPVHIEAAPASTAKLPEAPQITMLVHERRLSQTV